MKINRITDLLSAFAKGTEPAAQAADAKSQAGQAAASSAGEAANVAADFGVDAAESAERKDKVERLKQQVSDGSYNPDSREVATAVLKELGSL